jgi:glycerol-3-phosphate acyltransferase PlsX
MADVPIRAARQDTTVRTAVSAVAGGNADAFVSAGDSGAAVTAAVLELGRWVRRPALAATLPSLAGPVVLTDVGASVEASVAALAQNAVLGAAYASVVNGVAEPRVGLLSIGAEAGKGDRVRRAADARLRTLALPARARYVGNVEGYDVCAGGRADVVATDGFTGNVLLKGIEGAYALAGGKTNAAAVPRAAALLGVGGTVVVCHGSAEAADIASGIALAAQLYRMDAVAGIEAATGRLVEVL